MQTFQALRFWLGCLPHLHASLDEHWPVSVGHGHDILAGVVNVVKIA